MIMTKTRLLTTPKTCQLDGMENLSLTGFIKSMDLEKNLNVRFAEERLIGAVKLLKNIFNNGDTPTV